MTLQTPARLLTDVLSEEHDLLLRGLDLFSCYAEHVASFGEHDRRLTREFLQFFRDFGEHVHHEKEESLLFSGLERLGLPSQVGPLGVLRQEHEIGRDMRLALALVADVVAKSPGDAEARRCFRDLACRYVELMTAHIDKKELVLYPLAREFGLQAGEEILGDEPPPERELLWLASVEARATDWPRPSLSLEGLGTPYGFLRLCEATLAGE